MCNLHLKLSPCRPTMQSCILLAISFTTKRKYVTMAVSIIPNTLLIIALGNRTCCQELSMNHKKFFLQQLHLSYLLNVTHKTILINILIFKIQSMITFNFLCILLFWAALKCWCPSRWKSNFDGVFTKIYIALIMGHTVLQLKSGFSFYSSSYSFCLIASHMWPSMSNPV